jgi:tellurium resistance protein TerD
VIRLLSVPMAEMKRGANAALTREIPGLRSIVVGVSWNAGAERVLDESLVLAGLLCGPDRRVRSDSDFVFFNQIASSDLSVAALEQALGTDNEQLEIELDRVPADVERIVVVLYVNENPTQRRTLGQLRTCVVRVLNRADNRELVRSEELSRAFTTETAVSLGEVYRHEGAGSSKCSARGTPTASRASPPTTGWRCDRRSCRRAVAYGSAVPAQA